MIQQLIIDETGKPFPEFMEQAVLRPLGMSRSTFAQPLPASLASNAASGFRTDGTAIPGRWHVYPQLAAAGLWTTPSDLARFVIGIQQSLAGKSQAVISQPMARQMFTAQKDEHSLGFFIAERGNIHRFYHSGQNAGFFSYLVATENGKGFVAMANSDDGSVAKVIKKILTAVTHDYHWPTASAPGSP